MTNILHRNLLRDPVCAVRGDGGYIIDDKGRKYLDASGGAAVSCLGHSHPAVIEAIRRQVAKLPYAHTSFFTTETLEELGDRLVDRAPGMGKVMLLSGGSEAMEAAMKISRQYFVESGESRRDTFIARRQSYHGNTLGVLGVGGNEWRKRVFAPLLMDAHLVAPCFEYRDKRSNETALEYAARLVQEFEDKIEETGPDRIAGFIAETVVGATAGAVPPVESYFRGIRNVCDKYGIHLILDEVMCGSGRTGSYFAYEQEDIVPDIVAIAKGLAAGYQPIGAMLCRNEITDKIREGSGLFQHGHTFMGHVTAAAAANATIETIDSENLMENVAVRGDSIRRNLREMLGDHENIGDIRGRGLFIGVEFVADRAKKTAFDPVKQIHKRVQAAAMGEGLLCYAMGGTIDGRTGDHLLIAPPYNLSEAHEAELLEKLSSAITNTFTARSVC